MLQTQEEPTEAFGTKARGASSWVGAVWHRRGSERGFRCTKHMTEATLIEVNRTVRSLFVSTLCAGRVASQLHGMTEAKPRVFVVKDEQSIDTSLADVLTSQEYSVEIFSSAAEFLARVPYLGPGCIVLELPRGFDGLAFQRQLTEKGRAEPLVFVGGQDDIRIRIEALKRGAVDFSLKPFGDDELLSAVAEALTRSAEVAASHARLAKLTPREFEVFRWIISGLLNKEISEELGVTLRTVKAHRTGVMRKIGVLSVVELVRLALVAGVAPAQPGMVSRAVCSRSRNITNISLILANNFA
jgi:FixJ family two-component response regulator